MNPWILLLTAAGFTSAGPDTAFSAYSVLDLEEECTVLDRVPPGEGGSWVRLVCDGYEGYPIFYSADDLRVSLAYGFPDSGDGRPGWESFTSFNHVDRTVEWRLRPSETGTRPFAAIQRWYVYSGAGTGEDDDLQVLVVSRVAQPEGGQGCVVGYVDAQANADANELARRVADELAREFRCGSDEPSYHGETTEASPRPSRPRP